MPKFIEGFKNFVLRGNAVDLAVGVVIGASFGTVVTTLVKGLLTPFIGAVAKVPDFSGLFFTINGSKFLYGEFINALISFLLVAAAIYFCVILPMNAFMEKTVKKGQKPTHQKCPECLSDVPVDAKRCAHCSQIIIK
ncbi:MAG: large conductance mechanosensitive channel protein MscL [Candidatus Staskawiczbacteria bacterium]|jgi:large conductance mechanosensitive channel